MEKCKKMVSYIGDDSICTKNHEGFTFNNGDGGNPLVLNNTLYGIASWCDGPVRFPSVYTNVFTHRRWIKDSAI